MSQIDLKYQAMKTRKKYLIALLNILNNVCCSFSVLKCPKSIAAEKAERMKRARWPF